MSEHADRDVDVVGRQRSEARQDWTADIAQEPIEVGNAASDRVLRQATYIVQQGARGAAQTRPDVSPYGSSLARNEALWLLWSGTVGVDRDGGKLDDARRLAMLVRADETLRPRMAKLRQPEDRTQLAAYEQSFEARRDAVAGKLAKQDVEVAVAATRSEGTELEHARLAARHAQDALRRTLAAHAKAGTLLSTAQAQVDDYVADWMETYPDLVEMPRKDIFKGRFSQGLTLIDTWYNGVCAVLAFGEKDEKERLAAAASKGLAVQTATTLELLERIGQFTVAVTSAAIVGTGALALALGEKAVAHAFMGTAVKVCTTAGDVLNVAAMGRSAINLYCAENFAEQRDAVYGMAPGAAVLLGIEGPVALAALVTRLVTEALIAEGADMHRSIVTGTVNAALDRVASSRQQIALDAREWEVARQLANAPERPGAEGAVRTAAAREARIRRFDLVCVLESETGSLAHGAIAESFIASARLPGNIPAIKARFGGLHARAKQLKAREDVADHEILALLAETLAELAAVQNDGAAIAAGMVRESASHGILDGAYPDLK